MLIRFDVYYDGKFWCARGIDADIFTQGSTLDELYRNIREAVSLHFENTPVTILLMSAMEVNRDVAEATSY